MWVIIADKLTYISPWSVNISVKVCLDFHFVLSLSWASEKVVSHACFSQFMLVAEFGKRRLTAHSDSSILRKLQEEVRSWRSVNGPLSWVERFVHWGQCVAFMGDSTGGSSDHCMGKLEWSSSSRVPRQYLGHCTTGAGGGRDGCFSKDQGVSSTSSGSN